MGKAIIIAIILVSCAFTKVFAEANIKAEVDKTSISMDETLTYKITVTSTDQKIPSPQVPKFQDFNVISRAQSSSVSISGNQVKTVLAYAFILAPTKTGKFTIEPASVKIKKDTYSSESFEIEVTEGTVKPKSPKNIQPESEEPQITL